MSPSTLRRTLDDLAPREPARVTAVELDDAELAAWVEAVGLYVGAEVQVLRRAPLGGPLHVRATDGAELAVARDLARRIAVDGPAIPGAEGRTEGASS